MDTEQIIAELEKERDRLTQAIDALTASQATGELQGRRGLKAGRHLTTAERAKISVAMKKRAAERKIKGIVIGIVVYWFNVLREKRVARRMKEIGFLNHHIRNAMQAIKLASTGISDAQRRVEVIDQSVHRVVETLSRLNRETDHLEQESSLLFHG